MITRIIFSTALIALLAGCSKELAVKDINFDVTASKKNGAQSDSYTIADTLNFSFTGNPDVVTFYSGEVGKRYEYKDRTTADGTPTLQFSTIRANGTQTNSLSVLISSDFKGIVLKTGTQVRDTAATSANIAAATWTDLTSKAILSNGSTTATASGSINLSEFAGTPVYIAFRYNAVAGSIQNKWTISGLTVINSLADGTAYTIANLNNSVTAITNYGNTTYSPGWASFHNIATNANQYGWTLTSGTSLVITGATTIALATAPAEAWAIMGPLDLKKVTPDVGVGIKNITMKLDNYVYKYSSANNGKITFVASSSTPDQSEKKVKELEVTVSP